MGPPCCCLYWARGLRQDPSRSSALHLDQLWGPSDTPLSPYFHLCSPLLLGSPRIHVNSLQQLQIKQPLSAGHRPRRRHHGRRRESCVNESKGHRTQGPFYRNQVADGSQLVIKLVLSLIFLSLPLSGQRCLVLDSCLCSVLVSCKASVVPRGASASDSLDFPRFLPLGPRLRGLCSGCWKITKTRVLEPIPEPASMTSRVATPPSGFQ